MSSKPIEEQLSELFSYRAESLKEKIFELYTEPSYFPEFKSARTCVLMGGRGTGKTTALRGLSYDGQYALTGSDPKKISQWSSYGIYYRVNTNRVTIFKGNELSENQWIKLFAHYFNLLICEKFVQFFLWFELHLPIPAIVNQQDYKNITSSLLIPESANLKELHNVITESLIKFEAYINGSIGIPLPPLSAQGSAIDVLIQSAYNNPFFEKKNFFIIIDEYENFEPYQQQVVNTLIKHSGSLYSFKIGIKELGWRSRTTLNPNEQLISPADYDMINISDKLDGEFFKKFAINVCKNRLDKINVENSDYISDLKILLPGLSEDEEAKLLGIGEIATEIRAEIIRTIGEKYIDDLDQITDLKVYLFKYWELSGNGDLSKNFLNYLENKTEWDTRFNNYKHSMLFTILRKKRGIRKYYCGWDVFAQISGNNIRYLLELVEKCLLLQLRREGSLTKPISFTLQTEAAQQIGKKNLSELEGLSVDGARLTKLLLGLGRIFQILATDSFGHAPEINQFSVLEKESVQVLPNTQIDVPEADSLLNAAVRHLALVRYPGSKLQDESDIKKYDYMIHPIFAPFFVFSYRRKRKMQITEEQLIGLVRDHQKSIKEILKKNNRSDAGISEFLPDQLSLFESYYKDQ